VKEHLLETLRPMTEGESGKLPFPFDSRSPYDTRDASSPGA
jgi:hypothetical protein